MRSEAYLCKQSFCVGVEQYLFSAKICDLTLTCHRTALCLDHGLDIRVEVVVVGRARRRGRWRRLGLRRRIRG